MILLLSTLALAGPHEGRGERARAERNGHPAEMRENNPELVRVKAELDAAEAQLKVLVLDHNEAVGKAREERRAEIEAQAEVMYDLKTEAHALRLEILEAKLEEARGDLEERDALREERIEKWMEEHLEE
ncbi:MAG: hypothetical protein GY913_02110 [Proteobacteria bacterium]|nr:hypothetical protein [Pseudomonadota bacterium]MCP4915693.1 hypothetical protein [Pseudomonadota bacterium]